MTTYVKEFTERSLERAWEYAALRASLGHNVRVVTSEDEERKLHQVYFSSGRCHPRQAVNVNDVPKEDK